MSHPDCRTYKSAQETHRSDTYLLEICSINEVPAHIKIRVHELEAGLLIHRAHNKDLPFITDAHRVKD